MKRITSFFILLTIGLLSCSKLEQVDDVCSKMDDIKFMDYCYKNFDVNSDGKVSKTEAAAVREINVVNKGIVSLKGIEYFSSLTDLNCGNNSLKSLDVSHNPALINLFCYNNGITALDVTKLTELKTLDCGAGNGLTTLDVSKNTALYSLSCGGNPIKALDISKNNSLYELNCSGCQLTNLDVTKNTELTELICSYNQLTTLDISSTQILLRGDRYPDRVFDKINDSHSKSDLTLIISNAQFDKMYESYSIMYPPEEVVNIVYDSYRIKLQKK